MDIQQQPIQYRYHLAIAISVSVAISLVFYAAPRLTTIVAYFWPLFASTTLFVVAIIAFTGISQLAMEAQGGQKFGEDIVDYVAGHSHVDHESVE
ncbi:hypothetical protein PanWU01x14_314900 [Parasponia andersonii]|uniref:Transmembrane protein n=1 Tax=Parasponia andersonii TaxID=3476 RepID=A0A2P5ANM2_PARAD|nr:hypothetical protein PanWU01x14_314900 [Parasponia andersonii]